MLAAAHILVADDDGDLLDAITEAFSRAGALVHTAKSGAELIERLAHDGPFDLVVTDISMPWGTGLYAMHSARTAGVDTAVIVMTALRDEALPEQVASLGTRALLLRKPFELDELEALAAQLLRDREP